MAYNSFRIQDQVFISLLGIVPPTNKDLISKASKLSGLKRIDLVERKQLREEINSLSNTMKNKSKSMTNFYKQKQHLTPFNQFELLKEENKKVIKRKASLIKKNSLEKAPRDDYFFKIKKIQIPFLLKRNPQMLKISVFHVNVLNQPITCNHFVVKGTKIDFNKRSVVNAFLTSKISFNSKQADHSLLMFSKRSQTTRLRLKAV